MAPWGIPWCHLCGKWADGAHLGVKQHKEYMADFNKKPWPESDLKPLPGEDEDEEKDADLVPYTSSSSSSTLIERIQGLERTVENLTQCWKEQNEEIKILKLNVTNLRAARGLPQKSRSRSPKRFLPRT